MDFANCFLERAGQKTYQCNEQTDDAFEMKGCLSGMDSNSFTAFSNFFTHTHNMCQFLMSQIWREEQAKTISQLSETSARAVEATKESLDLQDTLLANQAETLTYQKQIAANGSALSQALESSRANARALMEEFRASTDEQRALIFSIFDRVGQLQSLVVSEVSWFYTVIFYSACLLVVYITTATKRTSDARIPLIIVLTINFVFERAICSFSLYGLEGDEAVSKADNTEKTWTIHLFDGSRLNAADMPQIINTRIWLCRKLACIVATTILSYFAYVFRDYNVENNQLLKDIQQQNLELRESLNALQISHYQNSSYQSNYSMSQTTSQSLGEIDVTDDSSRTLANENGEESDSDDSTLSFNSTQTDQTWKAGTEENWNDSDDSINDSESYYGDDMWDTNGLNETYSVSHDFLNNFDENCIDNLESSSVVENVSSTTSARIKSRYSRSPSAARSTASSVSSSTSTMRRRSCTPQTSSLAPLIENVESSSSRLNNTCYSLRDRSKIVSKYDRWDASESPNSFGKLVKKMAKITEKNSQKVRAAIQKDIEIKAASPVKGRQNTSLPTYSGDK